MQAHLTQSLYILIIDLFYLFLLDAMCQVLEFCLKVVEDRAGDLRNEGTLVSCQGLEVMMIESRDELSEYAWELEESIDLFGKQGPALEIFTIGAVLMLEMRPLLLLSLLKGNLQTMVHAVL